jgi:glycolate dehydrogenase FAD-binding subunit
MPDTQIAVVSSIESIVGGDNVILEPALEIDGIRPRLVVRPGSAEEVAACMKVCSEFRVEVVPAGQMTWLEFGNPLMGAGIVLSLERMRRIIDYSPPDLTATVEAGLPLSELNATAMREGQWLPLDPPGFKVASLGAIAACNSSGALRLGFGTPRDYVIGLRLAHADGTQSKSGGRVVKNVAGYDMNKLYVGSFGTLAVITELTFKLRPVPERSSTILIGSNKDGILFQLARRVLASELKPASVVLARGLSFSADTGLLIRFSDSEKAVANQIDWVMRAADVGCAATVLTDEEADVSWAEIADFDARQIRVRLSVPLSSVSEVFEKACLYHADCIATVDIGTGIIRIALNDDERSSIDQLRRLRTETARAGGTMVIEKAPTDVRREVDAWGDVGSTIELMRSIKSSFDPQSILNPGKFVSRI